MGRSNFTAKIQQISNWPKFSLVFYWGIKPINKHRFVRPGVPKSQIIKRNSGRNTSVTVEMDESELHGLVVHLYVRIRLVKDLLILDQILNPQEGTELFLDFSASGDALESVMELAYNLNDLVVNVVHDLFNDDGGIIRLNALKEFRQGSAGLSPLVLRLLHLFLFDIRYHTKLRVFVYSIKLKVQQNEELKGVQQLSVFPEQFLQVQTEKVFQRKPLWTDDKG